MRLLRETWIVGIVATLDCLSTIYLLHTGKAVEANPLLALVASWSLLAFFVVKMSFVIAPLGGLERIRRIPGKERFVKLVMRGGLAAYLVDLSGSDAAGVPVSRPGTRAPSDPLLKRPKVYRDRQPCLPIYPRTAEKGSRCSKSLESSPSKAM